MASAAGAIAILGEIAQLEPIAFNLVAELIHGLQGKSDADVLAGDSSDWASIVATAHQQAQASTAPPKS